jgi:hypothetical protein
MIDKKTVFILGAGASCPYGYPSGARLRELICFDGGFWQNYTGYLQNNQSVQGTKENRTREVNQFRKIFKDANIKSIDVFMADNPKLAPTGKYIIAYEVFRAEQQSCFGEEAKRRQEQLEGLRQLPDKRRYIWGTAGFQGGDWYFYLYNRLIEGLVGKDALPDFSDDKISFITFNYDRSLEHFLYESLSNSFTEVLETEVIKCLKKLKILHVYGQVAPLKWQDSEQGIDYRPEINEPLLQKAATNIKTIYEQKESSVLNDAQKLLAQAEKIFFLGFGYAQENLEVLKLPDRTKRTTEIYGTAFGLEPKEKLDVREKIKEWLPVEFIDQVNIGYLMGPQNMDCLELLKNYW